ncbi:MAG: hypothetical protein IKZ14_02915 [Muribaculaceae bacterium]|nr:hypothetical protein [Muribaculaceae bacterium]
MNSNYIKYFKQYLIVLLTLICCACIEDDFVSDNNIRITLDATSEYSGAESRAVFNDADEINITKYCVLIYDGTSADAKLVHLEEVETLPLSISLEASSKVSTYRAIVIGNGDLTKASFTDAKIVGVSTIADLNKASFGVSSHYSIPGNTEGNMDPDGPAYAGAAKNFTWSGYKDFTPNERSVVVHLNPNMARMKITVRNNTTSNGTSKEELHIVNLQIKNVRDKVVYAQNALSKCGLFVEPSGLGVTSYNIEKFELAPGQSKTREYYIPHNEIPTGGKTRPDAPANATYIEVDGVRQQDYVDIAYKLYPGTKINNNHYEGNYHILADHKYNITIDINKTGVTYNASNQVVPSANNGVEVQNVVLPTGTNCYMIHPKFTKTANSNGTVFELPIDRVNEYWGANKITKDTEWRMYVIWQDIPARSIYFTNKEGTTKTDYYSGKGNNPAYFKFDDSYKNLSPTTTTQEQLRTMYGNILVGLTTDTHNTTNGDQYNCLWSWHLWITDYNPDTAPTPTQAESKYNNVNVNRLYTQSSANSLTTNVPIDLQGYYFAATTSDYRPYGNVQHYFHARDEYWGGNTSSDEVWEGSGIYANKWIMDRHLGSKAPGNLDLIEPLDAFGLYYQYGRKDPFTIRDTYTIAGSKRGSKWTNVAGPKAIADGVKKPNSFYTATEYTTGTWASNGGSNKWFSPTSTKTGQKTLFDPCPAGWCLPVYDAFDFIKRSAEVQSSTIYGSSTYDSATLGSVLTIYYDAYNENGGWGDPNRHMATITSLRKVTSDGKYYKLDASFSMQREINQKGEYEPFGAAGADKENNGLAGCLWTLDGYMGLHGSGTGVAWLNEGKTGTVRSGSGRYARKMRGRMDSHKHVNRGHVLGYTVRCIQDPYN